MKKSACAVMDNNAYKNLFRYNLSLSNHFIPFFIHEYLIIAFIFKSPLKEITCSSMSAKDLTKSCLIQPLRQ